MPITDLSPSAATGPLKCRNSNSYIVASPTCQDAIFMTMPGIIKTNVNKACFDFAMRAESLGDFKILLIKRIHRNFFPDCPKTFR